MECPLTKSNRSDDLDLAIEHLAILEEMSICSFSIDKNFVERGNHFLMISTAITTLFIMTVHRSDDDPIDEPVNETRWPLPVRPLSLPATSLSRSLERSRFLCVFLWPAFAFATITESGSLFLDFCMWSRDSSHRCSGLQNYGRNQQHSSRGDSLLVSKAEQMESCCNRTSANLFKKDQVGIQWRYHVPLMVCGFFFKIPKLQDLRWLAYPLILYDEALMRHFGN